MGPMSSQPLLSVLIPTLESRRELFSSMLASLEEQVAREGLSGRVEIVSEVDDGTLPIGAKRNRLMDEASGRFVSFVDDDDEVSPDYLRVIVAAIEGDPEVEVVGIHGRITYRGAHPRPFEMSIRHREYRARPERYERPPHHLNPTRTDIARRYPFAEVRKAEDSDRALRMAEDGALRCEVMIEPEIYHYRSRRWWPYQWALDRTEWFRHPLGLMLFNHPRARRWFESRLPTSRA